MRTNLKYRDKPVRDIECRLYIVYFCNC